MFIVDKFKNYINSNYKIFCFVNIYYSFLKLIFALFV